MAITSGITHVWEFEADAGPIVDLVGSDDLTIVGTQIASVPAIVNNGGDFRTTQAYATLQSSTGGLDGVDALSVSSWVWVPTPPGGSRRAWITQSGTGALIRASFGPTNVPFVQMFNAGETITVIGSGPVTSDAWAHLGYSFQRGVGTRLYVNGAFDVATAQTVDEPTATGANLALNIQARDGVGGGAGTGSEPLNGQQDQFAIWSRALLDSEFAQIYNGGSGIDLLAAGGGGAEGQPRAMAAGWIRSG